MFGFASTKIDFVKVIYVCIDSCKSELNNKFEC